MSDNIFAALCHAAWFTACPILGPILIWLIFGRRALVASQAAEAINFQISLLIAGFLIGLLAWLVPSLTQIWYACGSIIGFAAVILTIVAIIAVLGGKAYRYPFIIRLIPG